MKYFKSVSSVAIAVASALTRSIHADSTLYSSLSGPTSTLYNYTAPQVGYGTAGIGDEYTTNFSTITISGMSFFGGLTRGNDYLLIEFYALGGGAPVGVYYNAPQVASVSPYQYETEGIGFHTLAAGDFSNGGSQITVPGSGYVIFAPVSYTSHDVGTGVTIQQDPLPPVFSLGFGQAPTTGSNNASISAMANDYYSQSRLSIIRGQVSTGAFANTANQYAQFSITGIGNGQISNGSTGASGVWSSATSGNWETSGNWQGGVIPSGPGQTATFADSIGAGSATVTLTANKTVGNVAFNGSSGGAYTISSNGANTLSIDNNGSTGTISVNTGSQTISAPISLISGLNINTTSGGLRLAGTVTGTGPVTVNASSSLTVLSTASLTLSLIDSGQVTFAAPSSGSAILAPTIPGLTLTTGATLALAPAPAGVARQVLVVTGSTQYSDAASSTLGLSIAGSSGSWTAKVDLANNDLIIPNAGHFFLSTVSNQILQGYNGGNWQGSGGIVSSSAAADPSHLTALGAIQNDDGTNMDNPLYTTFDGVTVNYSDLLVKYTYYGDANLDGKVDGSDYSRIDAAYLTDKTFPGLLSGWFNGDFNYDGVIDGSDYTLIDNAFNSQGAQLTAAIATAQIGIGTSAVPEPTSLVIIATASLSLLGRIRRSKLVIDGSALHI